MASVENKDPTAGSSAGAAMRPRATMPGVHDRYKDVPVKWLSYVQVGVGILCVILQIALYGVSAPLSFMSQGLLAGGLFIATGALGIVSSQRRTTCIIVAFLVTAVLSVFMTLFLAGTALAVWPHAVHGRKPSAVPISIIMIVVAVAEIFIAIAASVFACHGICFGSQHQGFILEAGQVQYRTGPNGEQQVVVVPVKHQEAPAGIKTESQSPEDGSV